jgi:tripartite-type tricarboxylate transporter receptor subunit TctC
LIFNLGFHHSTEFNKQKLKKLMKLKTSIAPSSLLTRIWGVGLCLLLSVGQCDLYAQEKPSTWPTKTVHILVGFPGGSTPDMVARALADGLTKTLGQAVVVDNKPGASGNIAADQVAKSTDDHTLGVVINGNLTSAKLLDPKLSYDPSLDFSYLSLLATTPLILLAPVNLPSAQEFIKLAQSAGDTWNYGSVGNGSVGHLGVELLKSKVNGMNAVHIPYSGNPQVITAMLGGQIQLALVPPGVALPQIHAGKLQAIGVTPARSALAPGIASLSEFGVRDFRLEVWAALVGSAHLSVQAKERLSVEISHLFTQEDFKQRLFNQGWQSVGSSSESLKQRVQEETRELGAIIKLRNIKLD